MDDLDLIKLKAEVLKIADQVKEAISEDINLDLLYIKLEEIKQKIIKEDHGSLI